MKKVQFTILLFIGFILAGCGNTNMQISPSQNIAKVSPEKSQVVFLRSSFIGGAINATLYEIKENDLIFIGIIGNKTKIAYDTTPGKRIFMVVAESADFMEANLAPGKKYYSLVTARFGAWKARFSLWPVRNDGTTKHNTSTKAFKKYLKNTKLVSNTYLSHDWYLRNAENIKLKQNKYWKKWIQNSPEVISERTLNLKDGI